MSRNKNHNSILFLTTLGLYLGLVLVGASPQVLAQAATARNFDIKDEFEFKDDLDKKPSDPDEIAEEAELINGIDFLKAITNFTDDLRKLRTIGKFDPDKDFVFSHHVWTKHFYGIGETSKSGDIYNPWVATAAEQLTGLVSPEGLSILSDKIADSERAGGEHSVSILSTPADFSISIGFTKSSPERAQLMTQRLAALFASEKPVTRKNTGLPVHENTAVTFQNNQVFIVTRLPRGSIDPLLRS